MNEKHLGLGQEGGATHMVKGKEKNGGLYWFFYHN
jgi:hypothetical protein